MNGEQESQEEHQQVEINGGAVEGIDNTAIPMTDVRTAEVSVEPVKIDYDEEAQKLEEKALRFLAKQSHPVIIPSYSSWFKFSEINDIEKKSIPDFFDNSATFKTPKVYMDTRDFMINTFRLSPYEYLTMTSVRKNLAMDVASIFKIHVFLEKWGLINYQIDPRSKPSLLGPKYTGHFDVVLDTPEGLKPYIPSELITSEENNDSSEAGNETVTSDKPEPHFIEPKEFPISLSLKKSTYDSVNAFNALQSDGKTTRQVPKNYICHTCGNSTMVVRYHNLRARDISLCSRCFQEGHFGANFQASDFIKLENNSFSSNKTQWSDQELLLLLEGIEMYEDQWDRIVEHIGTDKQLTDCLEKFLKLPIEDNYIKDVIGDIKIRGSEVAATKHIKSVDVMKAVDLTIKSLLEGNYSDILKNSIPQSAEMVSSKYLEETQASTQELVNLTIKRLNLKFEELDELENTLRKEQKRYDHESTKLELARAELSEQVKIVNSELSGLDISQKLVLVSEQVDSTIKDVEEEEKAAAKESITEELQISINKDLEALTRTEPEIYKLWSV